MSTLFPIAKIKLNNKRPPPHALIMRLLGVYLAAGHKAIDLAWRNNKIELTYDDKRGQWYGIGFINEERGGKIARELNDIRAFVLDHFKVITIGDARG